MTSFCQSLTVNTEVSHVVYVRASCLQGVLIASQLAGIAVYGNAGTRCCCPLTSRTSGGSDNFYNFFNSYNFYNLTSVTEKM